MTKGYVPPTEVDSPKRRWTLIDVLYGGAKGDRAAVALGRWDGEPVLAMRWNGDENNPIGNPQSRGLPTWFIVPEEFWDPILRKLTKLAPQKQALVRTFFPESSRASRE